ncbi:MAG: SAM-dependent methyltransferase [Verrucomicrobia bacterium]|nr:SAM-dependent methyltransferase [Verrucomicrobiota bacterium]
MQARLNNLIQEAIATQGGAIPFERFMELALYAPALGYYTRPRPSPVGKSGDFVTSVSLGPLFGRILAGQVARFRDRLGAAPDFAVVEYGAHRGALRAHITAELPDVPYRALDVGDPPPDAIMGCVLANEFLDALPVHRVRVHAGHWHELHVACGETPGTYREQIGPRVHPRLAAALADLPVALMEGYTTEVNLRALDWIDHIAKRLRRGFVWICDYGFERHDFFAPHRALGTLTGYQNHRRQGDPLHDVGNQDLTAHVEFTSLMEHAVRAGFEIETFTEQGRYLLQTGETLIRTLVEAEAGRVSALRGTLHELTHPNLMGRAFKVLVLKKP